jgi:ribosome-associated protein
LESKQRALLCAHYALQKKAFDIRILEIRELTSLTDYIVIASGNSDRQVQAIAESVRLGCKNNEKLSPLGVEGMKEGRWILIDYGDVMAHFFQPEVREFYDLESMWSEAPQVPLPPEFSKEKIRLQ